MPQLLYDQLNSFGKLDLSGSALAFPDTLNLDGANIGRMTVDIKIAGAKPAVGGTAAPTAAGVTVSVEGSNDSAFAAKEEIGRRAVPLFPDAAADGNERVAVSPSRYKYVRVAIAKTFTGGTAPVFTAGLIEALVNSYEGK